MIIWGQSMSDEVSSKSNNFLFSSSFGRQIGMFPLAGTGQLLLA
jgi:hypothetical protein